MMESRVWNFDPDAFSNWEVGGMSAGLEAGFIPVLGSWSLRGNRCVDSKSVEVGNTSGNVNFVENWIKASDSYRNGEIRRVRNTISLNVYFL